MQHQHQHQQNVKFLPPLAPSMPHPPVSTAAHHHQHAQQYTPIDKERLLKELTSLDHEKYPNITYALLLQSLGLMAPQHQQQQIRVGGGDSSSSQQQPSED